jgi:hypothetical protein
MRNKISKESGLFHPYITAPSLPRVEVKDVIKDITSLRNSPALKRAIELNNSCATKIVELIDEISKLVLPENELLPIIKALGGLEVQIQKLNNTEIIDQIKISLNM